MALDPTRPVMVDGGNCLADESLPVNGGALPGEPHGATIPTRPTRSTKAYARPREGRAPTWGKCLAAGARPADLHGRVVTSCAASTPGRVRAVRRRRLLHRLGRRTRSRRRACSPRCSPKATAGRASPPSTSGCGRGRADLHYNSCKPVCVFCRQWNWTFGGGSEVPRTLKVFNDTHYSRPDRDGLGADGSTASRSPARRRPSTWPRASTRRSTITVKVPQVSKRTAGEFVLTCSRGGKEVFREVKPVAVIDPDAGPKPSLGKGELVVLDPFGSVKARLQARGIAFTEVATARRRSRATAKVVVVGKDASRPARPPTRAGWRWPPAAPRCWCWTRRIRCTTRRRPPTSTPTDFVGRIAFVENTEPPGLRRPGPGRLLHLVEGPRRLPQRLPQGRPAGPSRWPIATSSWATRPSPSAR